MINFKLEEIEDSFVRDNFQKLEEFMKSFELLKGDWRFFELDTGAVKYTNKKIKHGFQFKPQDVIQLSASNGATVTWHYDDFDKKYIVVSTDKVCKIRAFVGSRYQGG